MPVQADHVPLDTAKTWAKRLSRVSKTTNPKDPWPLSRCQLAVATMLGYDHWHALNQALSEAPAQAKGSNILSKMVLSEQETLALRHRMGVDIPQTENGWKQYWTQLLDIEGRGGDIHVEVRKEIATIRLRVLGQLVVLATLSAKQVMKGLGAILEAPHGADELNLLGPHKDFVKGNLKLKNSHGLQPTFVSLPVYPGDWDMVLRAKPAGNTEYQLEDIALPPAVLANLRRVCSFKSGVFYFTGSVGTGRTELMMRVVNDRTSHSKHLGEPKLYCVEDPSEYRLPKVSSVPVIREKGEQLVDAHVRAIQGAMRAAPDILVVGETRDRFTAEGVFKASASDIAVFSTCVSSGANIAERMDDFGITADRYAQYGRGWACTRLLPLLCPKCSIEEQDRKNYRSRGPGCDRCAQIGVIGRQLVIDLWEVKKGVPFRIEYMSDQARGLVRNGLVAQDDAEELLGPLGW